MKGETYLYVADTLAGTADDAGVFKSSDFMSAAIGGVTSVTALFKAGEGYGTKNGVVTLTLPTLVAGNGTAKFKEACKVFSGALNRANGDMLVLADDVNSVYISPFTGVTVDDIN